ncbi:MAG: Mur ligase, partial [Chloroflexi bacterium CFX6]|nr:Mur ligase [Chloroflexi bacterium CFX6]
TLEGRPDAVIVKELRSHLRGRPEGEVPRVLAAALAAQGFPAASIAFAGDELEALDLALAWAEPGDLVVLMVHAQRQAVIDRLAAGGSAPSSHRPPPMA